MCRGVEVEVRRRRARRSSGTGAAAVRAEGSGSGKIQASRRSRCAARQGLRCGGKAWPRRRGLCSDRSNRGGGARVLGKDWGGDRSREVAEPVIGGGRDLGVRAVGHAGECHGEEERQRGVLLAVLGRGERQRRGATGRWGRRHASGRRASRGGTLTGGAAMSVGDVGARCAGARAERKGREKRAARAGPSGEKLGRRGERTGR